MRTIASQMPIVLAKGGLTDADHDNNIDAFLGKTYDGVRDGSIDHAQFVKDLAHIVSALDVGNTGDASAGFKRNPSQF